MDALVYELRQASEEKDEGDRSLGFPDELRQKLYRADTKNKTHLANEIVRDTQIVATTIGRLQHKRRTILPLVLASDAVTKKVRYRFVGIGNGRYTIEVTAGSLIDRIRDKSQRCRDLVCVFNSLSTMLPWKLGAVTACSGDARLSSTWPNTPRINVIITSPPYLPASSGREHYASARALAFYVLGHDPSLKLAMGDENEWDDEESFDVSQLPSTFVESRRLMTYLLSDMEAIDPQRDPMRFARKAKPTFQYLIDIRRFFTSAIERLDDNGIILFVVASQHVFYSHRRGEIEHVVNCKDLYSEIAESCGLNLIEELKLRTQESFQLDGKAKS